MTIDSGNRREFSTGAVRDIDETKGRCDLLPLGVVADLLGINTDVLSDLDRAVHGRDVIMSTQSALISFIKHRGWNMDQAIFEASIRYKEGAEKYEPRNWEKGIPLHSYYDSAIRHYIKYICGWDDEEHDRAVVWNLMSALWTYENLPEMRDL